MGEAKKLKDGDAESMPKREVLGGDTDANRLSGKEDANVTELKQKVKALVDGKFGGDYKKAFDAYDRDNDGAISKDELSSMLSDAKVGNGLTRGAWVKGIIGKMDEGGDQKIQWAEFQSAIGA